MNAHPPSTTSRRGSSMRLRLLPPVMLTVSALVLSACGAADDSSKTSTGGSAAADLGSCGKLPAIAPKDPGGALASLPAAGKAAYNGFPTTISKSVWAGWKPDHPAPYTVAISWNPPFNAFQTDTLKGLTETLEKSGKVKVIANVATTSLTDVPGQLQQFNELISRKPDLIILEPLAAGPFVSSLQSAQKAGIPVVSAWNVIDSPNAVSVGINNFLQAAVLSAKVVTKMGGKGEILKVHGIPGIPQDTDAQAGFDAVLKTCPGIKVAGEVSGNYSPTDTKAAVLKFLATHPGKIGGVLQSGTMTTGVLDAFGQLGRPVPAIADLGSSKGSIAYAHDNAKTYEEFGTSGANEAIGTTFANVALKMLAGDGPQVAQIITEPEYIDKDNLDSIYQDGWTVKTAGDASAKDDPFMTDETLASFFRPAS